MIDCRSQIKHFCFWALTCLLHTFGISYITQTTILEIVQLSLDGNNLKLAAIRSYLRSLPFVSSLSKVTNRYWFERHHTASRAGANAGRNRCTKLRRGIYLANWAVSVAWNCDSCPIVLKQSEMSPVDLISGYGNYFHLRDLCLPPPSCNCSSAENICVEKFYDAPLRREWADLLMFINFPRSAREGENSLTFANFRSDSEVTFAQRVPSKVRRRQFSASGGMILSAAESAVWRFIY